MRYGSSLFLIFVLLVSGSAWASPDTFTYQGRIVRDNGSALEYNDVAFAFTITNEAGNCVLYREVKSHVNMQGSKGIFDVPIGTGVRQFPTDPSANIRNVFINSIQLDCEGSTHYTAGENEGRILLVQFHDGVGWESITPSSKIRSVPFSTFSYSAGRLGNKLPGDFVLRNDVATCSTGQYLTFDGTSFACQNDSGGSGTVSDVNVSTPLTKGGTASIPTIGISVGTGSGTVAAGNDSRFGNALRIQGVTVDATAPTSGQVLRYDGTSSWIPATLAISDVSGLSTQLSNKISATMFPSSCTAGQSLVFVTPANKFDCYDISISSSQISGTIPFSKIASLPTTLSGYGITDALTGTGTAGYLPYYNTSSTLTNSPLYASGANVGIGTTSPNYPLTVNGIVRTMSGGIMFPDGTLQTSAAVSAGTNNTMVSGWPDMIKCQITGPAPASPAVRFFPAAYMPYTSDGRYYYRIAEQSTYWGIAFNSDGSFYTTQFNVNGSASAMTTDCDGLNISQLTAAGKTYSFAKGPAAQFLQNGTSAYYNAGRVGIGTSSPAYDLDVNGTAKATQLCIGSDCRSAWPTGGGGSGTVTSITAGTGLTGGSITTSGTIAVDVGTTASKIVQLDSSARLPAVDGSNLSNVNATKIQGTSVAITSLTSGNYLKYDGTNWVNASLALSSANLSDASDLLKASNMPANCTAGKTLTFSSPSGTWTCSDIVLPTGTLSGAGTTGKIPYYNASTTLADSVISQSGSNIGIGTATPSSPLTVSGVIESTSGGIKFPDGSVQTSAVLNAGSGGVTWQKICSYDFTAAATSYTFNAASGCTLNGDVDEQYRIVSRFVGNTSSGAAFLIQPNGDSSSSNYSYMSLIGNGSASSGGASSPGIIVAYNQSGATGYISQGDYIIYAKSGKARTAIGTYSQGVSSSAVTAVLRADAVWNNSAANITSLTLNTPVSNAIGIGSHIEIWAPRSWSGISQWQTNGSNINLPSGHVGIGTSSPGAALHVKGAGQVAARFDGYDGTYGLYMGADNNLPWIGSSTNHDFRLITNATEKVRVTATGNMGIGDTNPYGKLQVTGGNAGTFVNVVLDTTSTGNHNFIYFREGGSNVGSISTASGTSISYNTTSDVRLKDGFKPVEHALDKVNNIDVKNYYYKKDPTHRMDGFIAQQLYQIAPYAVTKPESEINDDGTIAPWLVDYSKMIPLVTAAVQQLSDKVQKQNREIASLKEENVRLKNQEKAREERLLRLEQRLNALEKMNDK